jgi:hypothetical protein
MTIAGLKSSDFLRGNDGSERRYRPHRLQNRRWNGWNLGYRQASRDESVD